jgi:hypothetical protein
MDNEAIYMTRGLVPYFIDPTHLSIKQMTNYHSGLNLNQTDTLGKFLTASYFFRQNKYTFCKNSV